MGPGLVALHRRPGTPRLSRRSTGDRWRKRTAMPMHRTLRRGPALLALAPLAASLVMAAGRPSGPAIAVPVRIGQPAGDLQFRDVTGRRYSLADLREQK